VIANIGIVVAIFSTS